MIRWFGRYVQWVGRTRDAQLLVVTNGWPNPDDPSYCIFIKRQMDSVAMHGVTMDVLFIRGYASTWAYPVASLYLALLAFRRNYKLVHAHGGEAVLAARFFWRAPLVASYLGDDLLGRPDPSGRVRLPHRLKRGLVRLHSRLCSRIIVKSPEMSSALPAASRRVARVVPNGVDTSQFRPMSRDAARRDLGWPEDGRVALLVANLRTPAQIARKRVWLAEQAMPIVAGRWPDARLEVASGAMPEDVPVLMNAADVLVLPSSVEGSPNVVKEALMSNLPVVATAAGDVEALLDGVSPSFVVEATPEAIAAGISACFEAGTRSNGRSARAGLSADAVARQVIDLYAAASPTLSVDAEPPSG